jgi:membrane-bound lytic murein transglycosylase A
MGWLDCMRRAGAFGPALIVAASLVGCASPEPPAPKKKNFSAPSTWPYLERVTDPAQMPDFRPAFLDREKSLAALEQSESFFSKPSSRKWFPYATDDAEITHERMVATLRTLKAILQKSASAEEFHGWCLLSFDVYRSVGADRTGAVLYTAYCEPIFVGSLAPTAEFRYPLYTLPPDLVKDEEGKCLGRRTPEGRLVSYYTRKEIEERDLMRGRELVYLRDPFEVYIAQVQGSARINLLDGRQMCVGYAGKTDRPYSSIGQFLISEGKFPADELSLTRLKRYFREHPEEISRVLHHNESYVFFMEREPGPFGSIGVKVTPFHSLATDKSIFPRGGPVIADLRVPTRSPVAASGVEFRKTTLLAFDQDTGGAIQAAGRADLFIGTGPEAELLAGHTQEEGRLFYLFAKEGARAP